MAKKDIIKRKKGEVIREAKIEGEFKQTKNFRHPQLLWIIGLIILFVGILLIF